MAHTGSSQTTAWRATKIRHATTPLTDTTPRAAASAPRAIWDVTPERTFTPEDAAASIALGSQELDRGFFQARLLRSTRAEREYLHHMALDGDAGSKTAVVAARLGRTTSSVGPIRRALMEKGIVYAPEFRWIAYTVPGMADCLRRHQDEGE